MKTNEKILKYLSGLMQEKEREEFEAQLKHSDSLHQELLERQKLLSRFKDLSAASENSAYFNNLLPKVRQRLEGKKRFSLYPKLAYAALPVVAIIAYFVISPFSHSVNQMPDMSRTISEMHEDAKEDILGDIIENETNQTVRYQVVSDSTNSAVLDNTLASELFKEADAEVKAKYVDTDDLVNSLSADEQKAVYNSLLNKKIL